MEDKVTLIKPGSPVYIGDESAGRISALMICVAVSANGVEYKCVWWDDRIRRVEWLTEQEVRPTSYTDTKEFGFANGISTRSTQT